MTSRIQAKPKSSRRIASSASPNNSRSYSDSRTMSASRSRSTDVDGKCEFTDWLRLSQKLSISEMITLRLLTSWATVVVLIAICLLPSLH